MRIDILDETEVQILRREMDELRLFDETTKERIIQKTTARVTRSLLLTRLAIAVPILYEITEHLYSQNTSDFKLARDFWILAGISAIVGISAFISARKSVKYVDKIILTAEAERQRRQNNGRVLDSELEQFTQDELLRRYPYC